MMTKTESLDYWRKFFGNSDIFDVIKSAILIAASDCPAEFHNRRARIAEILFSCRSARCLGCDRIELRVPEEEEEDEDEDGEFQREVEGVVSEGDGEKEIKVNGSADEAVGVNQMVSNYSYDEAEALTEELEEENLNIKEVFRIKGIIADKDDKSESVLFESLRRLQLMQLSVETLKATEIGKAVNSLRKHGSKQIRHLVHSLIDAWKVLVDEWIAVAPALEEATPESVNPSNSDDDFDKGLPSPPLDEGAFMAVKTTDIEFSNFFEGMDDGGNPQNLGEFNKNKGFGRRPITEDKNKPTKEQPTHTFRSPMEKTPIRAQHDMQNKQNDLLKNGSKRDGVQESLHKVLKSSRDGSEIGRVSNLSNRPEQNNELKSLQRFATSNIIKTTSSVLQDNLDNNSDRAKLEMAKRKLHERYKEAENAKRQRTVQVMELQDLPKQQNFNRKPFFPRQGNFNRQWANARH